jgi:hypothetical protein
MMRALYVAADRFDRTSDGWEDYAKWRGLPQLVEVVSIENPSIVRATHLNAEEWACVAADLGVGPNYFCFTDLACLQNCLARNGLAAPMLLCIFKNPDRAPDRSELPLGFELLGYDLVEDRTGVSSVSNCKGFLAASPHSEISECCLVRDFAAAREMQEQMPRLFPGDPHANCSVWAIARWTGD